MNKKIFFILIIILILTGCTTNDNRPKDVRPELWNEAKEIYQMISNRMKNGEDITDQQKEKTMFFLRKYCNNDELNATEKYIVYTILELEKASIAYKIGVSENNKELINKALKVYLHTEEEAKAIFEPKK